MHTRKIASGVIQFLCAIAFCQPLEARAVIGSDPEFNAFENEISIDEPSLTLAGGLRLIATESKLAIPIRVDTDSLARLGIDGNKAFSLKVEKIPAWQVLDRLLYLASPDAKLCMVIRRYKNGKKELIIEEFKGQKNDLMTGPRQIQEAGALLQSAPD